MKHLYHPIYLLPIFLILFACDEKKENATYPFLDANPYSTLPLYFIAGSNVESFALYKVSSMRSDEAVPPTKIVDGLTDASFITTDFSGRILISESQSDTGKIRAISEPDGEVKDLATNLDYPSGLVVDEFNQIYATETGQNRILKIHLSGEVSVLCDELDEPESLAIDRSGNLYVVESGSSIISKISPDGQKNVLTAAIPGLKSVAALATGGIIALTADTVSQYGAILKISENSEAETYVESLHNPHSIISDGRGYVFVSEGEPVNRISRISLSNPLDYRIITNSESEVSGIDFSRK